jgi:serine/threonine protein kinase
VLSSVDELPRAFGDYTLLRLLGRGGMGQVFLAQLKARGLSGIDKICVIKTLRPSNDPEYERRFIDEARLIVLLGHKNICPVFDAGCFEGIYYLAMEHVAGQELRGLQRAAEQRGAALPAAVVMHIIKEVLEALDAAHRMTHPITREALRVVHRDVSPQNVMVSTEGEVKLIDFGLAVSTQKVERTAPQIVMGKMAYMAPEQARGDVVDGRADQFACGVMLYELLTNERYYGDLPFDAMWRLSGSGGHLPAKLATLPDDIRAVIVRATAADRAQRFSSCGDMRDALTAIELSRGALAGSRDVRVALRDLESISQAAPVAMPSPHAAAAFAPIESSSSSSDKREATRTFRVVPADSGVSLIEGLEPGAMTVSARASQPAPAGRGGEATVVVRQASLPMVTAPTQSVAAPVPSSRRPVAALVGVGAVVLVLALFAARLAFPASTPNTTATVVDAGAPAVSVTTVPTVPAVTPPIVVEPPTAAVDAGTPVVEAAPSDAGVAIVDVEPVKPTRPTKPTKAVKKAGVPARVVPPLPPPPATFFDRTRVIARHCGDLVCAKDVAARLRTNAPAAEIEKAVSACYAVCVRAPPP